MSSFLHPGVFLPQSNLLTADQTKWFVTQQRQGQGLPPSFPATGELSPTPTGGCATNGGWLEIQAKVNDRTTLTARLAPNSSAIIQLPDTSGAIPYPTLTIFGNYYTYLNTPIYQDLTKPPSGGAVNAHRQDCIYSYGLNVYATTSQNPAYAYSYLSGLSPLLLYSYKDSSGDQPNTLYIDVASRINVILPFKFNPGINTGVPVGTAMSQDDFGIILPYVRNFGWAPILPSS